MKLWKFKLEAVRQHRADLEEKASARLAGELLRLAEASDEVRALREQELLLSNSFLAEQSVSAERLLQQRAFHAALRERLRHALQQEARAEQSCARARQEWLDARKDKEVITQLHDQQHAAHRISILAAEQAFLDDRRAPSQEAA